MSKSAYIIIFHLNQIITTIKESHRYHNNEYIYKEAYLRKKNLSFCRMLRMAPNTVATLREHVTVMWP